MKFNPDQTVREIAIENPRSVRIFESLGIDYCCGGKRSLQDACQRANVPLDKVLHLLSTVDDQPPEAMGNWTGARIRDLTQHIVEQHHGYVDSYFAAGRFPLDYALRWAGPWRCDQLHKLRCGSLI